MNTHSMELPVASIDVSKGTLEIAIKTEAALGVVAERFSADNEAAGWTQIKERLRAHNVARVGLEASGNYEAGVTAALREAGFTVLVFDPRQIHGFRRFRQKRAKTDPIDAALIADVTAAAEAPRGEPDPRLPPLAEQLTLIDMITEDIARLKTRRDRFSDPDNRAVLEDQIRALDRLRQAQTASLKAKVKAQADLDDRLTLLLSIPCIGIATALTIVIRMPELGHMTREQAAALVGVAPFNADSGQWTGERHIAGGRKRLRRSVFLAAFSGAKHWNPLLMEHYKRLTKAGKPHTLAIIACARKLIEIANAVLTRKTPWNTDKPVRKLQLETAAA